MPNTGNKNKGAAGFYKCIIIPLLCFTLFQPALAAVDRLRLAVTTTVADSGLISNINAAFKAQHDIDLDVIIIGSGQAFQLGARGDIDLLLVHAPDQEMHFINDGHGVDRTLVMHNDFVLLGPASDPAAARKAHTVTDAFRLIHQKKSDFVSRGDQSGTHIKEQIIWKKAGIDDGQTHVIGQGMGATLLFADAKAAYTLSDRGTYLAMRHHLDLTIIYAGDAILYNPYHIIAVNPKRHAQIHYDAAKKYIDFISGSQGQALIDAYRIGQMRLFHPANAATITDTQTEYTAAKKYGFFIDALIAAVHLILNMDQQLFQVVRISLYTSLLAVAVASIIAIPLGLIVALRRFPGRYLLLGILNALMALPTVIVGLLLYGLLNRQGVFGALELLYTPTAIAIGQCILILPVIWNLSIAAVKSADPRLQLTCLSLGANLLQQGLIYISTVRFALLVAVATGFGRAIGEVGVAMILGGNIAGLTRTMTTAITLETSKGEFAFALALGMLLLLIAFFVNIVLQRFRSL